MPRPLALVLLFALAGGCAPVEAVNRALDREQAGAPFPTLRPLDEVLGEETEPRLSDSSGPALEARAAALRARAAALRAQ